MFDSVNTSGQQPPEALYEESRNRFSVIWIVPITALLLGAWLIYQSLSQKGPTITITFASAEGIVAEKTVIKYKEIEVGRVTEVSFSPDLKSVIVQAEIKKFMKPYLNRPVAI